MAGRGTGFTQQVTFQGVLKSGPGREFPIMRRNTLCWCIRILTVLTFAGGVRGAPSAAVALSPSHPEELLPTIMRAYHSGRGRFVIPPGVYKLPEPRGGFYLSFDNMRNFRIVGRGVTLLRTDPTKGGIQFTHCRDVTLDGITLRCDPIPFTQGRIIALSAKTHFLYIHTMDIRINRGYQTDLTNPARFGAGSFGMVFSPETCQIKPGARDIFPGKITKIGRRTFRIITTSSFAFIRVGDLIEFRGNGGADVANIDCRRMDIEHVTVMGGTGFCYYEGGGGGNRYRDDSIVYPPRPPGATVPPLRASNADGLHSNFTRLGPIVEGCHFEGMGDDGIAIHGWYAMLRRVTGRRWVVLFPFGKTSFFRVGDRLKLYDPAGAFLGKTRVVKIQPLVKYQPQRPTALPGEKGAFGGPILNFYAVTVRHGIANSGFEDRISDTNANGSGFIVRHCVIQQNRARGMIIKADNGVIADNTIDGSSMGGIEVTPEFWWDESGCSSHLLIEGNTIEHVGYATADVPGLNEAGALSIFATTDARAVSFGHNGIAVIGNRFVDNNGINILVADAKNLLLVDNTFINPMRIPDNRGADFHFGTSSLMWLQQCKNVLLAGNRVTAPGPAMKKLVGVGPDVNNVMGIKDGVGMTRFKQAKKGS